MFGWSRRSGIARGILYATVIGLGLGAGSAWAEEVDDLTEMSLEDLMSLEVTSVSKKAQRRTEAAAAVTVITNEDLRRGGFTVIPEALRTVPGLQVSRVDANRWAISIRGFNTIFANKLLVLIDGRSVYNPAFGGTYWDAQDYPIEDVERIEVIRGPGGTVWGVNAVAGVINIITKHSKETQGTLISGYGGSQEYGATARYGGQVDEKTHYRLYARGFAFQDQDIDDDRDGNDEWRQSRLGFRVDSEVSDDDSVRLSGDFYDIDEDQGVLDPATTPFNPAFNTAHYDQRGGNVLVDWTRQLAEDNTVGTKAYYSFDHRENLLEEERHIFSIDAQNDFEAMDHLSVSWGADYYYSTTHIEGPSVGVGARFDPNDEDVHIVNGFAQFQVDLFDDQVSLIAGTKLGYHSWSGFEYQPSARGIWMPAEGHAIWGAISRAVRTPTQADRDIQLTLPTSPFTPDVQLNGDRNFRSEELLAFEAGYRFYPLEKVNGEISLFWNEYESVSALRQTGGPVPVVETTFTNANETTVRGFEVEVNVLPLDWWRIRTAYSFLSIDPDESPTAFSLGAREKDLNARHMFNVQTFFDLPMGFEFDASLYFVDGLPGVTPTGQTDNVESYVRLDLRLGYEPVEWLEIALVGQNLTDRRHYEGNDITLGQATQVPRAGYAKVTLDF